MKSHLIQLSIVSSIILSGCLPETETRHSKVDEPADKQTIIISNDADLLAERVVYTNQEITIDPSLQKLSMGSIPSSTTSAPALTLVAEVSPPSYNGHTLQATEIFIRGVKAYVSYNMQGSEYIGAAEVFLIADPKRPELLSSVIFTDRDVNGISVSNGHAYLATASSDPQLKSPAALDIITLDPRLFTDQITTIDLPSYAATDVKNSNKYIYATSGSENGYVSVFDNNTHDLVDAFQIDDARGVDAEYGLVAVIAGSGTKLHTFDNDSGQYLDQFEYEGTNIPDSKSTVEIHKQKALMATGDAGVQLVCISDGQLLAQLAPPIIQTIDPNLTVTNSVTADNKQVFIANGEAGVYLAQADNSLHNDDCTVNNLQQIGSLNLDSLQSANHVSFQAPVLFVAAGTGGLKILNVTP